MGETSRLDPLTFERQEKAHLLAPRRGQGSEAQYFGLTLR
jgi:hypothetical protein